MDWEGMTDSQREGKLVVFAVYLNGPFVGVYFYHLNAGDYSQTRKMLILK